jgi:hypothetical protein
MEAREARGLLVRVLQEQPGRIPVLAPFEPEAGMAALGVLLVVADLILEV